MDLSINTITSFVTIIFTGLTAGLCFTWSNAVITGLSRLGDLEYLQAFKEMNRAIINPTFLVVFFWPLFLHLIHIYLYRNLQNTFFWMLLAAALLFILGVGVVTVFGNIPLNEMLDKTNLSTASATDLKLLRNRFEYRWSNFHLIRTVTSIGSFALLVFALLQPKI